MGWSAFVIESRQQWQTLGVHSHLDKDIQERRTMPPLLTLQPGSIPKVNAIVCL